MNPETCTKLVENLIKWCVVTHTTLKKEKSPQHFIWSGAFCLETPACSWIAVLVIESSRVPVAKTWGMTCTSALRAGKVKVVNFRYLLTGRESPPRPRQNVSVNKSNQTWMTRGQAVRLSAKLFQVWEYSKEGTSILLAEMGNEQMLEEFAHRDTECQPNFVVQIRSYADRGSWRVLLSFRWIQEEESPAQRAEETESRAVGVRFGSLRRFFLFVWFFLSVHFI